MSDYVVLLPGTGLLGQNLPETGTGLKDIDGDGINDISLAIAGPFGIDIFGAVDAVNGFGLGVAGSSSPVWRRLDDLTVVGDGTARNEAYAGIFPGFRGELINSDNNWSKVNFSSGDGWVQWRFGSDVNTLIPLLFVREADGVDFSAAQAFRAAYAAMISGDTAGTAIEAGGVSNGTAGTLASGDLDHTDADNDDDVWQAASDSGVYGNYTLNTDGTWTYAVDDTNSAVEALNLGDTLSDTFTAVTGDGTKQIVTITIEGVNDAPTPLEMAISDQVTTTTSDFSLLLSDKFTDVDDENLTFSATGLPSGIKLVGDAISGTAATPGIFEITVTATDSQSASVSDTFELIAANNEATPSSDVIFLEALGVNTINALNGDDIIFGTADDDIIRGNGGDDLLISNGGNDQFFGGGGEDTFVLSAEGFVSIQDFKSGIDKIALGSGLSFANLTTNFAQGKTQILSGTDLLAQLQGRVDLVANDFVAA